MNNVNLNPGGLIGGLAGLGAACLFLYWKGDTEGRIGKLVVACVAGGAFAGNYLWGLAFLPKVPQPTPRPVPQEPTSPGETAS